MSESVSKALKTPVGDLEWLFITGKGKKNLQDQDVFQASLKLETDSDAGKALIQEIEDFWKESKPKAIKTAKSLGYKAELDENGEGTGYTVFSFWTGIEYPDGSPKVIKIFNAKGAEISLGKKKIGNGSRGRIGGAMGLYTLKTKEAGVTLYLNSIQLSKFVEYTGGDSFDAIDDDDSEEEFLGVEETGMDALTEEEQDAKPRL